MALVHTPTFNASDTGSTVRTNIDENFVDIDSRLSTVETDNTVDEQIYTPRTSAPTYAEGQQYYNSNDGTMRVQSKFSDVEVLLGHGMYSYVINNSGATITKGTPVRHNGVDASGKVQVVPAKADTFDHAIIFGVAAGNITSGSEGAIQTFGEITSLDTSALTSGVPIYLSDTVDGGLTTTKPAIVSQVGGVKVSDTVNGIFFVSIINNKTLPQSFGAAQGQSGTGTYSLTTTSQDINSYATSFGVVSTVDTTNGIITVPNDGIYRIHFSASLVFTSSVSTRSVTFEIYDITGVTIVSSFVKNIPRDATEDGVDISFPVNTLASNQYKMRVKASETMDITINDVSLDIQSINIK